MFSEQIAAGVAYLDENHPGWVDKVDLDVLYMGDSATCVLGQLVGEMEYFMTPVSSREWAAEHGFEVWYPPHYIPLGDEWKDVIQALRKEQVCV